MKDYCSDREVRLLLFYKLPRRSFGKRLACAVSIGWILDGLFFGDRIPILLTVYITGPSRLLGVEDGRET